MTYSYFVLTKQFAECIFLFKYIESTALSKITTTPREVW